MKLNWQRGWNREGWECVRGWHPAQTTCTGCYPLQSQPTPSYLLGLMPAKELAQVQGDPLTVGRPMGVKGKYVPFFPSQASQWYR